MRFRRPHGWRAWLTLAAALALAALPFLLWQDYLRSLYRSTSAAGPRVIDWPLVVYVEVLSQTLDQVLRGAGVLAALKLGVVVSLAAQAAYLFYRRDYSSPWWRVALPYAVLMLTVDQVVWDG